ncbi:AAA family ATPase [Gulosibacter massiliensis]|uniref:AAA family ATPase n=1 Tax=Gulosibacter massiliensis TaxID=2479839 RepID=UPI002545F7C8|nr:AAA family ATPase [Gulosibacter massiliensis]
MYLCAGTRWSSASTYELSDAAPWRGAVRPSTLTVVPRVLVTGMSGAGKSTLLDELDRRGHLTVDTDYDGWELPGSAWDERRMSELLATHGDVIVSGTVENQGVFYDRFDHVVLLSAPVEVLIERISSRTNNPYGRTLEQQGEVRRYVADVEPLLRRGASLELDGRHPVADFADSIEALGRGWPESHRRA